MVNYANLATIAQRLITDNGRSVTLIRESETVSDVSKPWRGNTASAVDSLSATAVLLDYDEKEVDGDLIRRSDQKALLDAKSHSPKDLKDYDRLKDGLTNETWRILNIKTIQPGDTGLLFILQLRQ